MMYKQLADYYIVKGISAIHFNCPYFRSCSRTAPQTFTTAKESFVSSGYVEHTLPRIVFLSLDSGSAEKDPALKTLESIRKWEEEMENIHLLPRNKHWYRTHELAYTILKNFKPDLRIDQARHYFAHVNSAKCCMNNPQRAQANQTLFDNCREFIPGELEILDPDIIITQGKWAKLALDGAFTELEESDIIPHATPEMKIILLNAHPVIWIETYHPRHPSFHSVNKTHYPKYTAAINKFIELKSSIKISSIQLKESIPHKTTTITDQPTLLKENKMTTSSRSKSMFVHELSNDEIFEKIIEGLKINLPDEILHYKPDFKHSRPNRLQIYLDKNLFPGSHYEICFRQDYFEFALHFESSTAMNLERKQAFDSHLNEISDKTGQFVKSGKLENKGRMRVWFEHKKGSVTEEQIQKFIDEYSRFMVATYPILAKIYQVNNEAKSVDLNLNPSIRFDQKVVGYIPLDEYPEIPPFDKPSKADCKGYKFISVVQLCNLSESFGKSRGFAHNAFGGDKGDKAVQADRQAYWWFKGGKQSKKFVLIRAVERFFEEEGFNWK